MIVAIDPDVKRCGVAVFNSLGGLVWVGLMAPHEPIPGSISLVSTVAVEGVDRHTKGSVLDLARAQHAGSCLAGRIAQHSAARAPVEFIPASSWAGTIAKGIRQQRTIDLINADEDTHQGVRHLRRIPKTGLSEAIDAIGLGLFVAGVTGRGGVPCSR